MAVGNALVKQTKKQNSAGLVSYDSNGTSVTLSFDIVKRYLVSGGGTVSDQEVMMFIGMCRAQHLNPFNRDAYLIKYGSNSPATMVTGKDVFLKRAEKHDEFDGLQAGIIVRDEETGEIIEREGTFYMPETEQLVGGWCKVFLKGRTYPSYETVNLSEYIGKKKTGEINEQWTKRPATMIRKVALVHALKEAFPEDLGALYSQEEMNIPQDVVLDEAPIQLSEDPVSAQNLPESEPEWFETQEDSTGQQSISDALFT